MNVLIITAHPETKSLNAYLSAKAAEVFERQGALVQLVNLYSENFDPCEGRKFYHDIQGTGGFDTLQEQRHHWNTQNLPDDVNRHINLLKNADLLILHFPLWWFGMPAILKGWMDRVFVYGGIYDSRHRHENGVMKGKKALLTVTTGASANAFAYNGKDGDIRFMLWPPIHSLHYIGFTILEPYVLHGIRGGLDSLEKEQQQLFINAKIGDYQDRLSCINKWPVIPFNCKEDFYEDLTLKPEAPEYTPFVRHHPNNWNKS